MPNYDLEPVMVVRVDRAEDLPDHMPDYEVFEVVFAE